MNAPDPAQPGGKSLKDLPLEQVTARLGCALEGLTDAEATERLGRYGYNELPQETRSALLQFLAYFRGPIPYMIMAAAAVSAVLGHYPTLIIILVLLVMNAVVGFREEHQAGNVITALRAKLAVQATVRRDGRWRGIPARELVPGDRVRLRIGGVIPADARLLQGDPIQVDQSALTGESLPVEHRPGDAVFSGTVVKRGEIDALVYATGSDSYYGETAHLVQSVNTVSHLQQAIMKIADYLLVIAVVLAVLIVAVALARHDRLLEVLQLVLVLIIAAVPVAMPAVMSVTMALGAGKLAARQAIVTRLSSVEEIAGIDVLCSDKTGTLTQGTLTPGEPFVAPGASAEAVMLAASLASRAEDQDPIDLAVLSTLKDKSKLGEYRVRHFTPFDPVQKRTEALISGPDGRTFTVSKGAPQVITALDPDIGTLQEQTDHAVADFAARGFRSLGVARTDDAGRWRLLGVIPLYDPLRTDSKQTIDAAKALGLEVKMVTGDQLAIAKEIARQLDLGPNIIDAKSFGETREHESGQLADAIEAADGFAQVFPEHKYHIVDVLQRRGHIVGMTGDGVNDAPALKKSDAGIAVSGATDAARSAASIALLSPGLSVIVDAIREARRIFERMLSYAVYRIAETVALLGFLTITIVAFHVYPVTAIMIVFLAILNDGSILSIAYDNTRSAPEPLRWQMRTVMGMSGALGAFAILRSFGMYAVAADLLHMKAGAIMTMIYLNLSVGGIFTLYAARTRGPFWSVAPGLILLCVTLAAQGVATLISVYGLWVTPIGWRLAGLVWGYCAVLFVLQDQVKLGTSRILRAQHSGYFARHAGALG